MKFGLNAKTVLLTAALFVVNSTLYTVVFTYQSEEALLQEFRKRVESLAQNLALNAELGILVENREALESLAQNLLREPDIRRVRILDDEGRALAEGEEATGLGKGAETIIFPVLSEPSRDVTEDMTLFFSEKEEDRQVSREGIWPSKEIGWVEITFTKDQVRRVSEALKRSIFWAAAFATVVGCGVVLFFTLSLVRPVKRLARATAEIADDHWKENLPVTTRDEIGSLTDSFNRMALSLRRKREELEATYKELAEREKMAEIGKFAMIIAHEVKNPLGIIKGSVDLMVKGSTGLELQATLIEYIQGEVRRLNRLVEDFLAFARPRSAQKAPLDINELVGKIASLSPLPESETKEIILKTELAEGLPSVQADEQQLYQAMLNLLHNAVQAIPHKGQIILRTRVNGRWLSIDVEDTGEGIPEEDMPKVFEPFYTNKEKGTGLGLSIVKKMIEGHDGEVLVARRQGGGARFTLRIPTDARRESADGKDLDR